MPKPGCGAALQHGGGALQHSGGALGFSLVATRCVAFAVVRRVATRYYQYSADRGDVGAQVAAARHVAPPHKDATQRTTLKQRAALQRAALPQVALGQLSFYGARGVVQNHAEAFKFFKGVCMCVCLCA